MIPLPLDTLLHRLTDQKLEDIIDLLEEMAVLLKVHPIDNARIMFIRNKIHLRGINIKITGRYINDVYDEVSKILKEADKEHDRRQSDPRRRYRPDEPPRFRTPWDPFIPPRVCPPPIRIPREWEDKMPPSPRERKEEKKEEKKEDWKLDMRWRQIGRDKDLANRDLREAINRWLREVREAIKDGAPQPPGPVPPLPPPPPPPPGGGGGGAPPVPHPGLPPGYGIAWKIIKGLGGIMLPYLSRIYHRNYEHKDAPRVRFVPRSNLDDSWFYSDSKDEDFKQWLDRQQRNVPVPPRDIPWQPGRPSVHPQDEKWIIPEEKKEEKIIDPGFHRIHEEEEDIMQPLIDRIALEEEKERKYRESNAFLMEGFDPTVDPLAPPPAPRQIMEAKLGRYEWPAVGIGPVNFRRADFTAQLNHYNNCDICQETPGRWFRNLDTAISRLPDIDTRRLEVCYAIERMEHKIQYGADATLNPKDNNTMHKIIRWLWPEEYKHLYEKNYDMPWENSLEAENEYNKWRPYEIRNYTQIININRKRRPNEIEQLRAAAENRKKQKYIQLDKQRKEMKEQKQQRAFFDSALHEYRRRWRRHRMDMPAWIRTGNRHIGYSMVRSTPEGWRHHNFLRTLQIIQNWCGTNKWTIFGAPWSKKKPIYDWQKDLAATWISIDQGTKHTFWNVMDIARTKYTEIGDEYLRQDPERIPLYREFERVTPQAPRP